MAKKEKIDYEISCINSTDYDLVISFDTDSNLMNTIYSKARRAAEFKYKTKINKTTEDIKEFEVPKHMLNLINTFSASLIKDIIKLIEKDGIIKILNTRINKCHYRREGDKWKITLFIRGNYAEN